MNTNNNDKSTPRVNNNIRSNQVRVVLEDGTTPGILQTCRALQMAREMGLDLVEINATSSPPVCKIMDFGRFRYQQKRNEAKAKKNRKIQVLKEIQFHPNIDINDLKHKLVRAKEFLSDKDQVKIVCLFRGREMAFQQIGRDKINWFIEQLQDLSSSATNLCLEGKAMSVVLNPK